MAKYYYYDNDGQKLGPVSGTQLKEIAQQGMITPGTVVETEEGKNIPAQKLKGLTFLDTPNQKATEKVYGLSSPVIAPIPVAPPTVTIHPTPSVAASSAETNPFTVSMPGTQKAKPQPIPLTEEEKNKRKRLMYSILAFTLPVIGITIGLIHFPTITQFILTLAVAGISSYVTWMKMTK